MYDMTYVGGSKALDFCVVYPLYGLWRRPIGIGRKGYRLGDPLRIPLANDYFRSISSTYGVMELQPGQVNWGSINSQPLPGAVRLWLWQVFAGGSQFTCTYRFRAPLYGYEQYHYGIIGTDGVTPTPNWIGICRSCRNQQVAKSIQCQTRRSGKPMPPAKRVFSITRSILWRWR